MVVEHETSSMLREEAVKMVDAKPLVSERSSVNRMMISVIMPSYRADPKYLKESIESILNQTYRDWELIIIMDKYRRDVDSKAIEIISQYEDSCRLLCVRNDKSLGIVASLNKGILLSSGEFIARMDHDDISEPERLALQLKAMQNNCLDFIGSWATLIDPTGRKVGELRPPYEPQAIRRQIMFHNPFLHPTMMIRKRTCLSVGLYDTRMGHSQDYELFMRLMSKGYLGANIPRPLVRIREHFKSITRGNDWIYNRPYRIKAQVTGFLLYDFHEPLDFLFLFASLLTFLITPRMVRKVKELCNLFVPEK